MERKGILILPKKQLLVFMLLVFIVTQSGCAILKAPLMIVNGAFSLVGKILKVVGKLPAPPPGVF